jgi:hypothetical protein
MDKGTNIARQIEQVFEPRRIMFIEVKKKKKADLTTKNIKTLE